MRRMGFVMREYHEKNVIIYERMVSWKECNLQWEKGFMKII